MSCIICGEAVDNCDPGCNRSRAERALAYMVGK